MKSLAAVVAALLVTVGAANAGEIVITPKASDRVLVLTLRGGKVVKASVVAKPEHLKDTGAANAEEFVINPKTSDRAVRSEALLLQTSAARCAVLATRRTAMLVLREEMLTPGPTAGPTPGPPKA